jgi:hypothetical protein
MSMVAFLVAYKLYTTKSGTAQHRKWNLWKSLESAGFMALLV